MVKGKLSGFLAGLFLGATALFSNVGAVDFRGFVHNSENGIPGANTSVKAYLKRSPGTIDTLYLTTNSNGRYNGLTENFSPAPAIGETLYVEAKKDTLGKSFKAETKWPIFGGGNYLYEITLDNPDKNVRAFTWNIDEFRDTTNYANTTITPLFWLNKNPGQKTIAELDTISNGLSSHPHYHDSWGNLQMQDSTWAQGDSASVLFQKNYTLKTFPDSIPYSLLTFPIDNTFWDAQLVKDTLKFPTDVSVKDWSIDSLFTTTAVNDSVEPKAFIRNNRTSLTQYAFPDSAKFYLTITGDGVNYSDSLVKRLDSGMNDTITFKKSYKGNGSCTLRCSTSVFGDATPTNNVKQWITSGPMAVELSYFGAMPYDKGIRLEWITQSSLNSFLWEIYRGQNSDTLRYDLIATQPGDGNSNQPRHYYHDDKCAEGLNWYRLGEVGFSGEKTFYGPINAFAQTAGALRPGKFKAYPNPARRLLDVRVDRAGNYGIYNVLGQKLGEVRNGADGKSSSDIRGKQHPAGIYFIKQEESGETQKVQVVR